MTNASKSVSEHFLSRDIWSSAKSSSSSETTPHEFCPYFFVGENIAPTLTPSASRTAASNSSELLRNISEVPALPTVEYRFCFRSCAGFWALGDKHFWLFVLRRGDAVFAGFI